MTTEATDHGAFGTEMRQSLLEDFVVAYINGSIRPNLAEKNPITGRDAEFLMDGPQFEKIKKSDIWSSSQAVGSGYQYRVVYLDRRFTDLGRLVELYTGAAQGIRADASSVEQSLFAIVLLLMKEGRLPQSFKLRPSQDSRVDSLAAEMEGLRRTIEDLEARIAGLEGATAAAEAGVLPDPPESA